MELTAKQAQGQAVVKSILTRCWEDANFKRELLANPVGTLEKYSDSKLNIPEGKQLIVVDQTDPSKVYFNIHAKPNFDSLELTDEQLELVAGGELLLVGGIATGIGIGLVALGIGMLCR
jgi:hypothetical protein